MVRPMLIDSPCPVCLIHSFARSAVRYLQKHAPHKTEAYVVRYRFELIYPLGRSAKRRLPLRTGCYPVSTHTVPRSADLSVNVSPWLGDLLTL